jgi:hypothetical protein
MSHLNEVRIATYYQQILRRSPSIPELGFWIDYLRAGGSEVGLCRDLASGYEFTLEAKSLFWRAFRRQPTQAELVRCRARVAEGTAVLDAVRETVLA